MPKLKPIYLVLLLALLLFLPGIQKPFYGYHDWNGLTYGQIARNYTRYGFSTKLGQVENFSPTTPDNFTYDTHYLPLFTLLLSLPVKLFGPQEWAIRLLPALFSLASLYLIYLLGKTLKDEITGLVAAILALLTPVFIYFGKNPVHEPLALFFILLNTYLFIKPQRSFKPLFISAFISLFIGWPTYYILPFLGIFGFLQTKQKRYLFFLLLPFIALSLHFLHVKLLTGSFLGGGLDTAFLQRTSLTDYTEKDSYTLLAFISRFALFSRNMFTLPLLLSALLGAFFSFKYSIPLTLLLTGIIHPLLFSNAGYIHDYLQFPALGFIALTSALFLSRIIPKKFFLPAGIFLAVFSFFTKLEFTQAMVNSHMSQPEYDLVTSQIKPLKDNQSIILPPDQATLLKGVVTPYYLQKEVEYFFTNSPLYQVKSTTDKIIITPYIEK